MALHWRGAVSSRRTQQREVGRAVAEIECGASSKWVRFPLTVALDVEKVATDAVHFGRDFEAVNCSRSQGDVELAIGRETRHSVPGDRAVSHHVEIDLRTSENALNFVDCVDLREQYGTVLVRQWVGQLSQDKRLPGRPFAEPRAQAFEH